MFDVQRLTTACLEYKYLFFFLVLSTAGLSILYRPRCWPSRDWCSHGFFIVSAVFQWFGRLLMDSHSSLSQFWRRSFSLLNRTANLFRWFRWWLFYPNVSSYSLHDQRLRERQDIGRYIYKTCWYYVTLMRPRSRKLAKYILLYFIT